MYRSLTQRCYLIILSREAIYFLALEGFLLNLPPKYFIPNEGKKRRKGKALQYLI